MLTIAKAFGGLNNRLEPHLLGPSQAQDLANVNLDSAGIQPLKGPGAVITSAGATVRSLYKFGATWLASAIAWQYREYGGLLYRAAAGQTPQKSADGATWYSLGIPSPVVPTTADGGAGTLTGDYQYMATYTSILGGESPPSPFSPALTLAGRKANVTLAASVDPQVNAIRLYRIGGQATAAMRVGEYPNAAATITDNTPDAQLGVALTTSSNAQPPNLEGIAITPTGAVVGWVGRRLYVADQGAPSQWGALNWIDFPETIRAAVVFPGAILVLTISAPYVVNGSTPGPSGNMEIQNVPSQQGCLGRDTAIDMGDRGVFWLSPDGLCRWDGSTVEVISKDALSDAFLAGINPANATAARFNERYVLFHPNSAAPGFLEFDPRTQGNWKRGTVTATACHYSRTDDALYIAQGVDVRQWEAGAALSFTYWTGDWAGESANTLKHHKEFAIAHDGTITLEVFLDGHAHGTAQTRTRSSMGRSRFLVPMGGWGRRVSLRLTGTGRVAEALADPRDTGRI